MKYEGMEKAAQDATVLLRAMANERRLLVLCHLARSERSVTELCTLVEMSPSALSQHLAKLRRDGLVTTRRDAQTVFYSLKGDGPREVLDALHGLYCSPQTGESGR